MFDSEEKSIARKYVEHIRDNYGEYGIWGASPTAIKVSRCQPLCRLRTEFLYQKVGDYGSIDVKTGEFEREGNIYEMTEQSVVKLLADHQEKDEWREKTIQVTSRDTEDISVVPASLDLGGGTVQFHVRVTMFHIQLHTHDYSYHRIGRLPFIEQHERNSSCPRTSSCA